MLDSSISNEQVDFLLSRERKGGPYCIAYGATSAMQLTREIKRIKGLEEEVLRLRQQIDTANAQLAFVLEKLSEE